LDYWRFSGELEGSLRVEPGPAIGRPRRPVRIADAITDASYLATIIFSEDPVAINRLYRDLRNIRTHFGERLLEAATTVHLADLHSDGQPGLHRWYLRQLKTLNFDRLKTRNFNEFEMRKFADFYRNTPLVAILCQSLYVMAKTINESAAAS